MEEERRGDKLYALVNTSLVPLRCLYQESHILYTLAPSLPRLCLRFHSLCRGGPFITFSQREKPTFVSFQQNILDCVNQKYFRLLPLHDEKGEEIKEIQWFGLGIPYLNMNM